MVSLLGGRLATATGSLANIRSRKRLVPRNMAGAAS